jgi:uncharacterized membrane protein
VTVHATVATPRAVPASAAGTDRLWEVDVARTVAIVMMATYHVGWDISYLAPSVPLDPFTGGWRALQVATGSSFLAIVGVSLAISDGRSRARGRTFLGAYARHARRALEVLVAGLLVTVATLIALGPDDAVRFGILQCIGVMMLLAPLALPLGPLAALVGAGMIALGLVIDGATVGTSWLMWLGLEPESGSLGVDYYPILPCGGAVLIGLALGKLLYPDGRRGPLTAWLAPPPRGAGRTGFLGRHALPVYLVHQLILFPLVALVLVVLGISVSF